MYFFSLSPGHIIFLYIVYIDHIIFYYYEMRIKSRYIFFVFYGNDVKEYKKVAAKKTLSNLKEIVN